MTVDEIAILIKARDEASAVLKRIGRIAEADWPAFRKGALAAGRALSGESRRS